MASEGTDPSAESIAVAQAMTASMNGLSNRIGELTAYGRRNRRLISWTIAGVLLDVVLTVGLVLSYSKANHADDRATRNHDQLVSTCAASNESRADVRELWGKLFKLSPSAPQTEEQKKRLADFRAYIDKTYAPRDCSHI